MEGIKARPIASRFFHSDTNGSIQATLKVDGSAPCRGSSQADKEHKNLKSCEPIVHIQFEFLKEQYLHLAYSSKLCLGTSLYFYSYDAFVYPWIVHLQG
jgi:hypothetical protein